MEEEETAAEVEDLELDRVKPRLPQNDSPVEDGLVSLPQLEEEEVAGAP